MFADCQKWNPLNSAAEERIILHYFTIAGRGELSKLIAAVGGVELTVVNYVWDLVDPNAEYKRTVQALGFEGFGLPLLQHGEFVIAQSGAIQDYLARIAKSYPRLTAQQQAIDDLFSHTLEGAHAVAAKVVFKVGSSATLAPRLDKLMGLLNNYVPETGFVHGCETPTKADLSVLVLLESTFTFGAAARMDKLSPHRGRKRYHRLWRLVERVEAHPRVRAYLDSEGCTLKRMPHS